MKKHIQTDSEWQEEMSQKIIDEIQCELYLDMPFMKLALSALSPKVNETFIPWQLTAHIFITIPSG